MRFARVHKAASYLLALLGLVALCTGGELGAAAMAVMGAVFVASWFAEGEIVSAPWYVRGWNAVVVIGLVVELIRGAFFHVPAVVAAIEFAVLLQLSRLANRRTARDYQQITVLAMLHLIAATVLGGGLSYAACFVGFVIVTPWAMTLGHLRREIEGNYLADARAGRAGVPIDVARILRSRRVVGPGLLIGSSLLALPVFALTAVIFVVFPRIGLGFFSLRSDNATRMTGLGDEVDLAGHGTIRDDPTIVLRVEPPDLGAHPPPFRAFRLRGAAFDHYDAGRWTRSSVQHGTVAPDGGIFDLHGYPDGRSYVPYRIVMDALDPPLVLIPEGTIALRLEPRMEGGRPSYPTVTMDVDAEVRYGATDDLGLVYTAYVGPRQRIEALSDEMRTRYVQVPVDLPPRVIALAHQWTDGAVGSLAKADAVMQHLRTFRYTLELESGGALQPLDDFLFRTRAGHCEYFSSALAVLLRTVGIPTRNVTGFLGGTYNRWGHFYAVRQGDAHSWAEVYTPDLGWVTYDPTPPAREEPVMRTGPLAEADALIEAMRMRWRRYIVSFDLGTQARLATRFASLFETRTARGVDRAALHRGTNGHALAEMSAWVRRHLWGILATVSIVVLAVTAWLQRRERNGGTHRVARVRTASLREALALVEALDTTLAVRGSPRPRARSPVGFAKDLAARGSPLAPLIARVAGRYAAARFGDEPLNPGELDDLRKALRQAPDGLA